MKVTFYCDIPEYYMPGFQLWATTQPGMASPSSGFKRVGFVVDMPIKHYDEAAKADAPFEVPVADSATT